MKQLIKVTQQNIDEGKRQEYCKCPIALAIKDALPYSTPYVGSGRFTLTLGEWYDLSTPAQDFIANFDFGKPVAPFEFEIEIPEL